MPLASRCCLFLFLSCLTLSLPAEDSDVKQLLDERSEAHAQVQEAQSKVESNAALERLLTVDRALLQAAGLPAEQRDAVQDELINTLSKVAALYEQKDVWAQAEEVLQERLDLQRTRFGTEAWQVTDARLELETLRQKRELSASQRSRLAKADETFATVDELYQSRRFAEAVPLVRQAMEVEKELLGEKHRYYANSVSYLASVYRSMGEHAKAEPLYRQAMEIYKEVLGEKHPDYATNLNNLAALYDSMGEYAKAEPLYRQAMEIRKEVLGEKHPDYAQSLNNLAGLYDSMGEYAKAESLYRQALEIQKEILGEKHPDYALILNNLAGLYYSQGEYTKAEPLYRQTLEIQKEVLGAKHPDYALSLNNLAELYYSQGEYAKSEPLYRQALEIQKEVLGERHPDCARSLGDLARLYDSLGEYAKAEPLYRQALEIQNEATGKEHPVYAKILHNLAGLYHSQGEYTKAEPLYRQTMEILNDALGEKDRNYAASLNNLALLYHAQGEYAKAEPLYRQATEIWKEVLVEKHPYYAVSLNNLAGLYHSMGEYTKVEPLYRQALEIQKEVLGEKHPDYADSLNDLAMLYDSMGEYAKAEPLYRQAMEIRKEALGEKHPDYADSLNDLAMLYDSMGEYAKSEPLYLQAMEIRKEAQGEKHPDYADSLNGLASLYYSVGEYAKAETLYRQAMEIRKEVLGEKHPDYARTLNNLAWVYQAAGNHAVGNQLFRQAIEILKDALGEKHPSYGTGLNNLALLYYSQGEYAKADAILCRAFESREEFLKLSLSTQSEAAARRLLDTHSLGADGLLSTRRHLADSPPVETYQLSWRSQRLLDGALHDRRLERLQSPNAAELYRQLGRISGQLAQLTLASVGPEQQEERQHRLAQLNEQKEELERQLAAESTSFRRGLEVEEVLPSDLIQLLPADVAVVNLVRTSVWNRSEDGTGRLTASPEYDAFLLRKSQPDGKLEVEWLHLGPAHEIDAAIADWLAAIDQGRGEATSQAHPAAVLRELLWEPLEPHLQDASHVVIVPDSGTSFVPWAALPGRKPGTFLLEDFTLSTAISGQELYRQLTDPPSEKQDLLLVGGVDYRSRDALPGTAGADEPVLLANRRSPAVDAQRHLVWTYLPGTMQEVKAIQEIWPRSAAPKMLLGAAANEETLLHVAPQTRFLHLATHGFFADAKFRSMLQHDPKSEQLFTSFQSGSLGASPNDFVTAGRATVTGRNPLILSGVVLAGANLPPEQDELGLPTGTDGIMTAQEVVHMDLRGTELVTLSACDTGRGTEVAGGEGIYGLQRAFHFAGARHVVASLWKVDDAATAALMKLFYHNLWQQDQPPAEALRNAQLMLLNNPDLIDQLATARGPNFNQTVQITKTAEPSSDTAPHARTPVHLWAAFTHSGPPAIVAK